MAYDVTVLTYADALAAGFVSFASPCALALVPGYLAFVSGASYQDLTARGSTAAIRAGSVARATAAFVAGFAAMFTMWGAGAGYLGDSLNGDRDLINVVSGSLLIAMGILMILLPHVSFLQGERRVALVRRPSTLAGIAAAGAAFAIAWTPCTGPFLGQVLSLAVPTESPRLGASLLLTYALGLGIPFLLAGLFLTQTMAISAKVRDHWRVINLVAGVITIALGVLVATGRFTVITQRISDLGFGL